jgi:hypothetical protein
MLQSLQLCRNPLGEPKGLYATYGPLKRHYSTHVCRGEAINGFGAAEEASGGAHHGEVPARDAHTFCTDLGSGL